MGKLHIYYVYILTTFRNSVLYVGVTNDLVQRCFEHKTHAFKGFTARYNVNKLVYFETFNSIFEAIDREKQIKGISRSKKIKLIESLNPGWDELFDGKAIKIKPVILREIKPSIN